MNTAIATSSPLHPSTPNLEQLQQKTDRPNGLKEAIAANVKCLIEQLEAGHSDALTAYLNAMSRFHNYSFGNVLEIAWQRPTATRVAGLYAWSQLGRKVKKGEKGIRILAPIIGIKRKKDEEAEKDITRQNTRVLVGFRNAYVFDVSQTEGAELPALREMSGDAGENRDRPVENLQRRDVHPLEEANSFKGLLDLEEPKYRIEQIAAKIGKPPAYVATRLKLIELAEVVVEEFYREEIGVGHALLLAELPLDKQEGALKACFREDWSASSDRKAKRILLPVRNLQTWIEQNILLVLKDAPFDKKDAHLVAIAGSCVDCPKRTGHNKLLFSDLGKQDACSDPSCYQAKVDAHVANTIAVKPKLVQISTGYTKQQEGSAIVPRGKYVAILTEKPKDKEQAQRPQFKTCKFTAEAIIADGEGKGQVHKVCANPACPIHHRNIEHASASFSAAQMGVFLHLLIHLDFGFRGEPLHVGSVDLDDQVLEGCGFDLVFYLSMG